LTLTADWILRVFAFSRMNIEKCGFLFVGAKYALSKKKLKVNGWLMTVTHFIVERIFLKQFSTDFKNSIM